jgi:hypothetical protein
MKRPLFLSALACLSALYAFSQQNATLSLSIGPSQPVGKFADKNANDNQSGLAKHGGLIDISYSYLLKHSSFGLTASLRGRLNPIDLGAAVAPVAEANPGYQWSEPGASWKTAALMVGAYHCRTVARKVQVREAILLGVAEAYLPAYSASGIHQTDDTSAESLIELNGKKAYATTFSGVATLGISYQWTKKFALLAGVDFWYLKPYFKSVTVSETMATGFIVPGQLSLQNAATISYQESTTSYTQPMNSIDLSIGISMRL